MSQSNPPSEQRGWLASSGLPELFRVLSLSVHPAKIGLALAAIVATFLFGGILDWVWQRGGGVPEDAIARYIASCELDAPYVEGEGDRGIFETWRKHEQRCVIGLLGGSIPGSSLAAGTSIASMMDSGTFGSPVRNLSGMMYGLFWLVRHHFVYFLIFVAGALAIWSLAGGAICRIAAVQFARGDKLTAMQGVEFARTRLFGGFFLAPCIPLAFMAITVALMALGGVMLRVPLLGDLVSLLFVLALFGGVIVAVLGLGLIAGGNLFWPVVAAEGSDAFDAFSRGLAYPFSRPWRALLYYGFSLVFAAVCWLFVRWFAVVALMVTRGVVAWGTSPFGWWTRGTTESPVSKLELLWPLSGPHSLHAWPDWSQLGYLERFSALAIGINVLLVIAATWAFLASFYFCASTVVYFLLRRDVDGADIGDVFDGDEPSMLTPTPELSSPA